MPFLYRREQLILFCGDLVVFTGALWLALVVRHFVVPSPADFWEHLVPFAFLFICWLLVFVTVGLYDKHVALFEHRLAATITEAQIVNMLLAVVFFFLAPIAIQPKTILALYFVISTALVVVWRLGLFRYRSNQRGCEPALIVGTGPDIEALVAEIRRTPRTNLECAEFLDSATMPSEIVATQIPDMLRRYKLKTLIIDPRLLPAVPRLRDDRSVDVIDASELYESFFSRVALTMFDRERFLAQAFSRESKIYSVLKRVMDFVLALFGAVLSLLVYPFVIAAIKLDDGGPIFIWQDRVGQHGAVMQNRKFRSMQRNDLNLAGAAHKTNKVTRVGNVIRKTRIDELPQLWDIVLGRLSLIGPRPELPTGVAFYDEHIPHYGLRHYVKPGLSGWAQIYHDNHPHHGTDIEATREKLSYDLYYIKHRSLVLDLDIALKTLKTVALRVGA